MQATNEGDSTEQAAAQSQGLATEEHIHQDAAVKAKAVAGRKKQKPIREEHHASVTHSPSQATAKNKKNEKENPSTLDRSPEIQMMYHKIQEMAVERDRLKDLNERAAMRRLEELDAVKQHAEEQKVRAVQERKAQRAQEASEKVQFIEQRREVRLAEFNEQREREKILLAKKPLHIINAEHDAEQMELERQRQKRVLKERHERIQTGMFRLPMLGSKELTTTGEGESSSSGQGKESSNTAAYAQAKQKYDEWKRVNQEKSNNVLEKKRVEMRSEFAAKTREKLPPIEKVRARSVPLPPDPQPTPKKVREDGRSHTALGNDYFRDMKKLSKRKKESQHGDTATLLVQPEPANSKERCRFLGNEYMKFARRVAAHPADEDSQLKKEPNTRGEHPTKEDLRSHRRRLKKNPVDVDDYIEAVKAKMDLLQKLSK